MKSQKIRNIFMLACMIFFLLFLFSCSENNSEYDKIVDNNMSEITILNLDGYYNLVALYDNNIILSKDEWCKDENGNLIDVKDYTFYKYNLLNSQMTKLLCLNYSGTGTGDYLIMNENLLINSTLIQVQPSYNLLFELNLINNELREIEKTALFPPFQFLTQLNDNEIIIYEPNKNDKLKNAYNYNIKKYNVITKEINILKKTNYDISTMTGTLISSVFCSNNKIFALIMKDSENFYVEILNENGDFINEISLDYLNKYLNDIQDSIWRMRVIDDYFIFETINREFLIYELENNKLTEIDTDISILKQSNMRLSVINQNKNQRYIFFYKYLSNEIYLFDTETEEIINFDINIEDDWKQIEQLVIDDNGNIVVSAIANYDLNNKRYYYLNHKYIPKDILK